MRRGTAGLNEKRSDIDVIESKRRDEERNSWAKKREVI